jgi:hypothetical protein
MYLIILNLIVYHYAHLLASARAFPKNLAFSSTVWNLPCPILEAVSINLRVISSCAVLEV